MNHRPCVFFDRDGIVNQRSPELYFVVRIEDFHVDPAFLESLSVVREQGYPAAIITNQRAIAAGCMTPAQLDLLHNHLMTLLHKQGLDLLGIYVCPHEKNACLCRKPLPGLILRAAAEHTLDLKRSWMIGDSETDVQAGHAAGCRTVLVNDSVPTTSADFRLSSMPELPPFLRRHLSPAT